MPQLQKITDAYGNRHIIGKPYKSRATALLFDPMIIRKSKAGYGGQYKDNNDSWSFGKARISYRAKQQNNQIFDSVGNYILKYKDQGQRLNLFKNALQTKITDAKQTTSQYNIQQLAQFFPWMMSCQLLFDPIRTYLYCLTNNLSPSKSNLIKVQLPPQMINNEVNRAIYESVRTNNSLIQNAKSIYSKNHIGVLIKGFRLALRASDQVKKFIQNFKETATSAGKHIMDTIINIAWVPEDVYDKFRAGANWFRGQSVQDKSLFTQQKMKNKKDLDEDGVIKFFDQLTDQIFKQLRNYGQIVINFNYIRNSAVRRFVNGKLLYYYLDRPNLLFGIQNSFVKVYFMDINNVISIIQPADFNIVYLRKLVGNQVVSLGGRMMKSIKNQITKTDDQAAPFNRFMNNYLNWKQHIPQIKKADYTNLNEQTILKRTKMKKEQSDKINKMYDTQVQDKYGRNYAHGVGLGMGLRDGFQNNIQRQRPRQSYIQRQRSRSKYQPQRSQLASQFESQRDYRTEYAQSKFYTQGQQQNSMLGPRQKKAISKERRTEKFQRGEREREKEQRKIQKREVAERQVAERQVIEREIDAAAREEYLQRLAIQTMASTTQ